jgi:multiple sugar transport system ATP-binding protein
MRSGVLQQVDRPQVLYERPANLFVAGFIGSPAMNFVEAELAERNGGMVAVFGPHDLQVPPEALDGRTGLRDYVGRKVALGIRPEDIDHSSEEGVQSASALEVTVDIREDMGSEVFLHFSVNAPPVTTTELKEVVGEEALAAADVQTHHHGSPFVARVSRTSDAREGRPIGLTVDTRHLHFFDLASGDRIHADQEAAAAPAPV